MHVWERWQSMLGALWERGCFSGGSGASSWNHRCKAIGSTGSIHFPRQGAKELRILLIFLGWGENSIQRDITKKSSEVVRGKGKGEWKAKIQEYTRGKNQKSQPFDNILFHNVHSPMFQPHEWTLQNNLKCGLYPGSNSTWQLSYIFEMPIGY